MMSHKLKLCTFVILLPYLKTQSDSNVYMFDVDKNVGYKIFYKLSNKLMVTISFG